MKQPNGTLTVVVDQVQPSALRSGTHVTHKSVDVHMGHHMRHESVRDKLQRGLGPAARI